MHENFYYYKKISLKNGKNSGLSKFWKWTASIATCSSAIQFWLLCRFYEQNITLLFLLVLQSMQYSADVAFLHFFDFFTQLTSSFELLSIWEYLSLWLRSSIYENCSKLSILCMLKCRAQTKYAKMTLVYNLYILSQTITESGLIWIQWQSYQILKSV